ncbi:hypothetical protein ACHAXA_011752 [Cyclostephanos tholiformis]|uniref:Protein CASP n=1 Tax=Cyclostephanos tholiformis TaxID=382380 RepID=A0ABD3RXM8_9STRA
MMTASPSTGGNALPPPPPHSSSSSSSSSSLSAVLDAALSSWARFDLTDRRPHLDASAQSLLDAKEASLIARKKLGDATKNLKRALKSAEEDNASGGGGEVVKALTAECKSTIRMYQEEIDMITRRCKSAEGAFVMLYGGLHECPDPTDALRDAKRLIEGRDAQVNNLLGGMEEMNRELEKSNTERIRLAKELREREREMNNDSNKPGSKGGGELSLAEREELIRLRNEVAEFEVEFRGLKNQDITIRKLEAKIEELEANKEEDIQRELKKAREELAESEGRRAAEALEREAATSRKLESVELQLRAERAGREASSNQLLRAEDGLGEREAAWEAQRHILVQDAERLREELGTVRRERDAWRLRSEASSPPTPSFSGGGGNDDDDYPGGDSGHPNFVSSATASAKLAEYMSERKAYEAEIAELSITCNALREELRSKEDSSSEERRSLRITIDSLERERSSLTNRVSSLEMQLANSPSQDVVDKMRHELRILKRLEYNAVDFDHRDPEMTGKDDDLESVLVAKLRKVEAELVRERREKSEEYKARNELNQRLVDVQKSLDDAQDLIASLENDLQIAVATPTSLYSSPVKAKSGDVPYGSTNPPNPNILQRILDPKAPPVPQDVGDAIVTSTAPPSEKDQDDHSVATIIMAQRDRLRSRCDTLEAERDSFKRELQVQVQNYEGLKTDNAKLYEKVRYLQSFNFNGSSGGAVVRGRGSGDLDLEALEQRYEATVDPFRQFSRAERQRKFNEMSPMEKIVFIIAKTTLGSKEMRTTLFFYVLGMHLLVFVTTYQWSHSTTCDNYHIQPNLAHFHGGVPLENVAEA